MTDIFQESLENIRKFEENKEKHGSVIGVTGKRTISTGAANNGGDKLVEYSHEDVKTELALTQEAYIDGPANGKGFFTAHAIDKDGNEYDVYWDIKEGMEDAEDMQEMCDWDNPSNVEKI